MTDDTQARVDAVKATYGDNHWWDADDKTLAFYQLNEDIIIVDVVRFMTALGHLLGRPVLTHELAFNLDGLRREAEAAYNGAPLSGAEVNANIDLAFERAQQRLGDKLIVIEDEASE